MAAITVRTPRTADDVWQAARWAFGWLLRQAVTECDHDAEVLRTFEQGVALDGLHLHLMEPRVADAVRQVLLRVASLAAAGEVPPVEVEGRVLEQASQRQFQLAAAELVKLLRRAEAG